MGIDKSLTDEFPSVVINGMKYHYGRELRFGQYLIENAEYAKDNWCFNRKKDLLAFLVNLPESADRELIKRRYPTWNDVTHEERMRMLDEHRAYLRKLMEEKLEAGTAEYFNVLCFDQAGWYSAYAHPLHWYFCDNVEVQVREQEVAAGRTEFLIELSAAPRYGKESKGTFKIWRKQALDLASALVRAALDVESCRPEPGQGEQ